MKKHLVTRILAAAAVLVLTLTGSACSDSSGSSGKTLSPADVVAVPEATMGAFDTLTKLGLPGSWSEIAYVDSNGDLVLLSAVSVGAADYGTAYTLVYNLATGSTLYRAPSYTMYDGLDGKAKVEGSDTWQAVQLMAMNTFVVTDQDGVSTLYGSDGGFLLRREDEAIEVSGFTRRITAGYQTWELLENGSLQEIVPEKLSMATKDITGKGVPYAEDYVHSIDESARTVCVYRKSDGGVAAFYCYPSEAVNCISCPLNNGNVLIQYKEAVEEPEGVVLAESAYDIVDGEDEKWLLHTLLLSAENGETTELELPYVVEGIYTRYFCDYFQFMYDGLVDFSLQDTVENVAYLRPIRQKHTVTGMEAVAAVMGNDGTVKELTRWQADQYGLPQRVGEDRYVVSTVSDRQYLYDGEGKLIGDVTGSTLASGWIVSDRAVFDYDGDVLLDYTAKGWTLRDQSDTAILFCDEDTDSWYLFDGDKPIKVPATRLDIVPIEAGCVFRDADTGKYTVWGGARQIGTLDAAVIEAQSVKDGGLLFVRNAAGTMDVYFTYNAAWMETRK